jgi:serine/threonine protein kinase/Flp pilus assembly protein TadD
LRSPFELSAPTLAAIMKRCEHCNLITTDEHAYCPDDGRALADDEVATRLQASLGAKYTLTHLIGKGAMGAVYRARHRDLDDVAIKVMLGPPDNQQLSERFIREARALRKLRHQHAVTIYDVDRSTPGLTYMVMEMIAGGNLREDLRERGRLALDEVMEIATAVCGALQAAHERGIIHRDIKPDNILMNEETTITGKVLRTIKIADFGIVKLRGNQRGGEASIKLTQYGTPIGTPFYMSPEQWFGEGAGITALDGRTDLYALGCTLYELLSGRTPFIGNTTSELRRQHLEREATPLYEVAKNVPEPISRVIMRTLAKDRDERYQSAAEFGSELRRAYDESFGKTVSTTRSQLLSKQMTETIDPTQPPTTPLPRSERQSTMEVLPFAKPPQVYSEQALTQDDDQEPMPIRLAKAVEEARRRIDEEQRRVEEESKRAEEEEARKKAEEEARQAAAAEEARRAEERQRAELEARRKREEEEAKRKAEEEARQREEEERRRAEAQRREEEERRRLEEETERKAKEEAQRKGEEEARLKAEEEARRTAEEEARRKAEAEEARLRAEAEDERKRAEEAARQKALEEQRQTAEAKRRAEEEARRKAEEAARLQAEQEAKRLAEARQREEEAARLRAEQEQSRLLAEQEAQRRAEEERQRAELETRRRAEEDEARRVAAEQARLRAEQENRRRVEEERQRQEREQRERDERERALQAERERIERERRELDEQHAQASVEQPAAEVTQPTGAMTMRSEKSGQTPAQAESVPMVFDGPSTIEDFGSAPSLPEVAASEADTKEKVLPVEATLPPPPSTGDAAHHASIFGYTSGAPSFARDTQQDEEPFDPEVTLVPGINIKPRPPLETKRETLQEAEPEAQGSEQPQELQPPTVQEGDAEPQSASGPQSDAQPSREFNRMPEYKPAPDYASWTAEAGGGQAQVATAPRGKRQVWFIAALALSLLVAASVAAVVGVYLYRRFTGTDKPPVQQVVTDEDVAPVLAAMPKGTITVSAPQGSEVFIDDERAGATGANNQLTTETLSGVRNVRVTKSGSRPWTKDAQVAAGSTVRLSARLQRELKSDGDADHEHRSLIEKYTRSGNYYGAEVEYRELLKENPNDVGVHVGLAEALNAQQRYAEALVEYEAALRLQPNNVPTLLSLGQLYEIKKRDADAEATFARAVELQPKNASAQALLAWVLLRRGKPEQASNRIEQALAIKADPEYLDTKAYILLARGQTDEALKLAQGNVEKSKDPAFKAVLAVIQDRMGQRDAAISTYKQLRQSSRDDEWGDLKRLSMFRGYSKSVLETLAKLINATN